MEKFDSVITAILTAITIGLFAFILGKKKEDIAIALNYQEYYDKFINSLKKEIAEQKEIIEEQKRLIEEQKKNIDKWSNYCEQLKEIANQKDKEYQKLLKDKK